MEPPQRYLAFLLVPRLAELRVEANFGYRCETLQLLLARYDRLAVVQTALEAHLCEVDFTKRERTLILFDDAPAGTDEFLRIEGFRAVDGEGELGRYRCGLRRCLYRSDDDQKDNKREILDIAHDEPRRDSVVCR